MSTEFCKPRQPYNFQSLKELQVVFDHLGGHSSNLEFKMQNFIVTCTIITVGITLQIQYHTKWEKNKDIKEVKCKSWRLLRNLEGKMSNVIRKSEVVGGSDEMIWGFGGKDCSSD